MSDIKSTGPSKSQRQYISEDEKITAQDTKKATRKKVTSSEPSTGPGLTPTINAKGQPTLKKAEAAPDPDTAIKYLKELIKHLSNTIYISPENIQALLTQFEQAGGKPLTPAQQEKATEMWNSLTPEQRKEAFNDAIFKYAMTETGEFTNECKKYLQDPNFDAPRGVPTIETKKAYSIFTLMLILSEIANFQRDTALKGMQLQQKLLEVNFDKQISNITWKAGVEVAGSIISAVTSGGLSFMSGLRGGRNTAVGMQWAAASEGIGGSLQALAKFSINVIYDPRSAQIEKERSGVQFNQQTQKTMNDAAEQSMRTATDLANSITQDEKSARLSIAHNI